MDAPHAPTLDRSGTCRCGARGRYARPYDAFYCPVSGVWLEIACADPTCASCAGRPAVLSLETP